MIAKRTAAGRRMGAAECTTLGRMARSPRWKTALAAALALAGLHCGAKTGLRLPDASPDAADVTDVTDVTDVADTVDVPGVCVPRELPIERLTAEVLFVIDRSGSMNQASRDGRPRWVALTAAMTSVLPAFEQELWAGLLRFPTEGSGGSMACAVPFMPEIPGRPRNAQRILEMLGRTRPEGGTPTFDALSNARRYFNANPAAGQVRGRFVVLATDGGPNCNGTLDPRACSCTNPRGCNGPMGNISCLDTPRVLTVLRALRDDGVSTFVIGTPGDDARLAVDLDRFAVEGGQARPEGAGGRRFYAAEDSAEFAAAFRAITTSLARCRWVTNPLADPEAAEVLLDGRVLPRDPSRAEGWDWARTDAGEFTLHGEACERAGRGGRIALRERCAPTQ